MVFEHDYDKFPELTNAQLEEMRFTSPHKQITEDFTAVVIRVQDGDTITLRVDFRDFDFPLRFLGIDAPELNEGGEVAKEWLTDRLLDETVDIKIDRSNRVGKYGRLLGRVVHQGSDVGEEQLRLGQVKKIGFAKEGEVPDLLKFFSIKTWLKAA